MNNICFIMPIYPPHFGYANAFVRSFFRFGFDLQADLAFVFTDKNEAQMFKHINFNGYYKSLILPKYLRVSRDNGIINIKKFYALKKLHKSYEYLIIIDSESEIIKNIHLKNLCDEFYAQKRLFGNATICDASKIKNESKKFFAPFVATKAIPNDDLYFWFNQPCIYKGAFIEEFFRATNLNRLIDLLNLNFFSFDFYVYGYFLLLYKDFQIENVEVVADWGFLELTDFKPQSEKFKQFCFYQCNFYLQDRLNNDKLFLIIQKDKQKQNLQDLLNEVAIYYFGAMIERYGAKFWGRVRLLFMIRTINRVYKIQKQALNKSIAGDEILSQSIAKYLQDYLDSCELHSFLAYKLGVAYFNALNNHIVSRGGGIVKSAIRRINISNRLKFGVYQSLYFTNHI